jgi:DNA-binding response OmpR family regulator
MNYSILVVDDEQNLRFTLSAILQEKGYFVTTAASGEEALELLSAIQYDLMFLDLKMPGLDGMEVLAKIQATCPDMPVLILTANTSLDTAVETLRRGAAGYLLKPVDPEQILSRVKEALREHDYNRRRDQIIDQIQKILIELDTYE